MLINDCPIHRHQSPEERDLILETSLLIEADEWNFVAVTRYIQSGDTFQSPANILSMYLNGNLKAQTRGEVSSTTDGE